MIAPRGSRTAPALDAHLANAHLANAHLTNTHPANAHPANAHLTDAAARPGPVHATARGMDAATRRATGSSQAAA